MADDERRARVQAFWEERARLGAEAGTQDLIAKQLEVAAISTHVRDGMRVLDVGCGNGETALGLARRWRVEVTGVDYAAGMVAAAEEAARGEALQGTARFLAGDVASLPFPPASFDLVYTERALINLPDWSAQRQAIAALLALVAPGGAYVMCENSQDGLERLNALREQAGLPAIEPPWHNLYFRDALLDEVRVPGVVLESAVYHGATYYLLSRVVNAWLAAQEGHAPAYDAPVNQLALLLPPIGELGQGRTWVWRRTAAEARA